MITKSKIRSNMMDYRAYFDRQAGFLARDVRGFILEAFKLAILVFVMWMTFRWAFEYLGTRRMANEYQIVQKACGHADLGVTQVTTRFYLDEPLKVSFVCERK